MMITSGPVTSAEPPRPPAGYRVLSLTEQYAGPFATLLLSDLGADVVVIGGHAPGPRTGCPRLGEHTEAVLAEAGLR